MNVIAMASCEKDDHHLARLPVSVRCLFTKRASTSFTGKDSPSLLAHLLLPVDSNKKLSVISSQTNGRPIYSQAKAKERKKRTF